MVDSLEAREEEIGSKYLFLFEKCQGSRSMFNAGPVIISKGNRKQVLIFAGKRVKVNVFEDELNLSLCQKNVLQSCNK
jgi:hypothetical protein